MSTQEQENNELDGWFRKSLEEPDIPFDPEAWQAMEKKLDGSQRYRSALWKRWALLLLLLLGGISTGIWYSLEDRSQAGVEKATIKENQVNEHGSAPVKLGDSVITNKPVSSAREPEVNLAESHQGNSHKDVVGQGETDAKEPMALTRPKAVPTENSTVEKKFLTEHKERKPLSAKNAANGRTNRKTAFPKSSSELVVSNGSGGTKEAKLKEENSHSVDRKTRKSKQVTTEKRENDLMEAGTIRKGSKQQSEQNHQAEAPGKNKVSELVSTVLEVLYPTELKPLLVRLTLPNVQQLMLALEEGKKGEEVMPTDSILVRRKPTPLTNRIGVLLFFAPDLSTVGFSNFTKPGTTQGLGLEYALSERLSIWAGALYSNKIYYASADDYTPPGGWRYKPSRIDGRCAVIDLPINVRYALAKSDNRVFYLSGGLSSYLMQRERYKYEYHGYPTRLWEPTEKNRHWLSVVNLSAGYEWGIGGRFTLRLEPYLKVPIAGVGAGKVRLSSTGVFLGLRYGLGKGRKNNW